MSEPVLSDNPAASRYEIHVDDALAGFATYEVDGSTVAILHTEVDDAYAGQGLASKLATFVLNDLRTQGRSLLPYCPFFAGYVQKHPEYADLVPADRRDQFGL